VNQEAIKAWLKRKKSSGAAARCLLAFVALLAGAVVLFLTFWFAYAVIWFCVPGISAVSELAFSRKLRMAHEWRLILSGIFLALLFIQHFRTNPWHWGDYGEIDEDRAWALGRAFGPFAALLSAPGASANIIADILLSGPRLFMGSWNLWRESRRFGALDEECCGQLLAVVASRHSAVPFDELREAGWEEWFSQLRCIEGVVFLEKGLTLTPELRKELAGLETS
jgi:hypothetical protein